jgi:hypothetical protein
MARSRRLHNEAGYTTAPDVVVPTLITHLTPWEESIYELARVRQGEIGAGGSEDFERDLR